MNDADCTPGREPRSVADSSLFCCFAIARVDGVGFTELNLVVVVVLTGQKAKASGKDAARSINGM